MKKFIKGRRSRGTGIKRRMCVQRRRPFKAQQPCVIALKNKMLDYLKTKAEILRKPNSAAHSRFHAE